MTITGLLLRFFLGYVGLLAGASLTLGYLGIKGGSWINTGVLIGMVYWVCMSFGQKNKRYFTQQEKVIAVVGMLAIDVMLQLLISLAVFSEKQSTVGAGPIIFAVGFVGFLHAVVIYYFVSSSRKIMIKQNIIDG